MLLEQPISFYAFLWIYCFLLETNGTIPDAVGFKQPTALGLPWRASSIRLL
jgi:hypothetical protein